MQELLTIDDLAKLLKLSSWTIRTWASANMIPRVPGLGRIIRFDSESIQRWLEAGGVNAARAKLRGKPEQRKAISPDRESKRKKGN